MMATSFPGCFSMHGSSSRLSLNLRPNNHRFLFHTPCRGHIFSGNGFNGGGSGRGGRSGRFGGGSDGDGQKHHMTNIKCHNCCYPDEDYCSPKNIFAYLARELFWDFNDCILAYSPLWILFWIMFSVGYKAQKLKEEELKKAIEMKQDNKEKRPASAYDGSLIRDIHPEVESRLLDRMAERFEPLMMSKMEKLVAKLASNTAMPSHTNHEPQEGQMKRSSSRNEEAEAMAAQDGLVCSDIGNNNMEMRLNNDDDYQIDFATNQNMNTPSPPEF